MTLLDILELAPLVEALIFAADGPIKAERMAEALETDQADIILAIEALEVESLISIMALSTRSPRSSGFRSPVAGSLIME